MKTQTTTAQLVTRTSRRGFLGFLGALIASPSALVSNNSPGAKPSLEVSLQDERESWLQEWTNQPRIPIHKPQDPLTAHLLAHAINGQSLALFYSGGSHPGRMRRFSPDLLFRHEGSLHVYVSGFCHQEQAPRILRLDRIALG